MNLFSRKSAIDTHYALLDKIGKEKNEDRLEALCLEDIRLVSAFNKEYLAKAKREAKEGNFSFLQKRRYVQLPKSYPSFKKLAVLYERRKDYKKAIDVCRKAIAAGYPGDGTEGGMKGRIAKLQGKME